ncbi:MAG: hypothetical protein K0Q72_2105, partial [Armatimonadetes bacterium]|nr:hypothetical protein [Armatimonadota bacterium]
MRPHLNGTIGWLLLAVGFAWGAALDPWALEVRDPALLAGSLRTAARLAQAVVLGMGFLQLLVQLVLSPGLLQHRTAGAARLLTAAGALLTAVGYPLQLVRPEGTWLVAGGALLNLAGFGALAVAAGRAEAPGLVRAALWTLVFGMTLDAGAAVVLLRPELFPPHLGAEDGVRLRMLRLAGVAAIALPLQTILLQHLAGFPPEKGAAKWGGPALAVGAAGMPLILTIAALGPLPLKYLLWLPADAVLFGAGVAVWLAFRNGTPLERWGWGLVLASMVVGQLMGGYAFDGPLPPPPAFGHYNDFVRRLSRLGHAYAILLGLLALFAAVRLRTHPDPVVVRGAFPVLALV